MTQKLKFLRHDNTMPTCVPSVASVSQLQPCDGGVGVNLAPETQEPPCRPYIGPSSSTRTQAALSEVTEMDGNSLVRAGICGFESRLRSILPQAQCSSGTTQSRPFPARAVKVRQVRAIDAQSAAPDGENRLIEVRSASHEASGPLNETRQAPGTTGQEHPVASEAIALRFDSGR